MKIEHPIFKTAVLVLNQEECEIAKQICLDNELPIWDDVEEAFRFVDYGDDDDDTYLQHTKDNKEFIGFCVDNLDDPDDYNIISMEEFQKLAENYSFKDLSLEQLKEKFQETLKK